MSKREKIENHLKKHGKITAWQSIMIYRYTGLAVAIHRLRKQGYNIVSIPHKYKSFVTYKLIK